MQVATIWKGKEGNDGGRYCSQIRGSVLTVAWVDDHLVLTRVFINVQSLSLTTVMWCCAQSRWKTASLVLRGRWLAPTEGHCHTPPSLILMTARNSTSAGTEWCPSAVAVQQEPCTTRSPSSAMSRKTFLDGKQNSDIDMCLRSLHPVPRRWR